MSFKSQLYPLSSTYKTSTSPWGSSPGDSRDMKFLRSWLVYDSQTTNGIGSGRANWNMLAGFALMAVVSAGGWSCVALLVRHFLK
jgi:hypothetical protein